MINEYVIMTIIEPPSPEDPLPGEAVQVRVLDLACDKCINDYWTLEGRILKLCDIHENLNVLKSRRAFRAVTKQQLELFPQGISSAPLSS
jgi:hypothetical protein